MASMHLFYTHTKVVFHPYRTKSVRDRVLEGEFQRGDEIDNLRTELSREVRKPTDNHTVYELHSLQSDGNNKVLYLQFYDWHYCLGLSLH